MCWVKQNRSIPANNWQFRYSLSIHTVVSFVFNTEKPDPCAMRPCTYRGTCVPDWSNMTYTCVCDSKYKGDHCERGKATTNLNIHWYKHFWFHITLHPVRTRVENTPAYHIPPSSCDILSPLFFSPRIVCDWNILPEAVVRASSSEVFRGMIHLTLLYLGTPAAIGVGSRVPTTRSHFSVALVA